jgi:hypothetical protein
MFYLQYEYAQRSERTIAAIARTLLDSGEQATDFYQEMARLWNEFALLGNEITALSVKALPSQTRDQPGSLYEGISEVLDSAEKSIEAAFKDFEKATGEIEASIEEILLVNQLILDASNQLNASIDEYVQLNYETVQTLQRLIGILANEGSLTQVMGNYISSDTEPIDGPRGDTRNPITGTRRKKKWTPNPCELRYYWMGLDGRRCKRKSCKRFTSIFKYRGPLLKTAQKIMNYKSVKVKLWPGQGFQLPSCLLKRLLVRFIDFLIFFPVFYVFRILLRLATGGAAGVVKLVTGIPRFLFGVLKGIGSLLTCGYCCCCRRGAQFTKRVAVRGGKKIKERLRQRGVRRRGYRKLSGSGEGGQTT